MSDREAREPEEDVFAGLEAGEEEAFEDVFDLGAQDIAEVRRELLQKELELLRVRLALVSAQVGAVARSGVRYANASAGVQLATRPLTKLGVLAATSFLITATLRRASPGPFVSGVTPLLLQYVGRNLGR